MTLQPLLEAPVIVQVHAFVALAAFALGIVQLSALKGTGRHRAIGYIWVTMMMTIAASSFFINGIRQLGPFSLIHLLSLWTLFITPVAVLAARSGNIARHRLTMISLYAGALVIAGAFTLLPGRIMHDVVFAH